MRKFAVIGLSSFGHYLCKYLSAQKYYVMAIDIDEGRVEQVKDWVDKAVIADATDKQTLEDLGITELDVVIVSMGDRIDSSVLTTLHLHELGVEEIVAKAVSEDHGKVLNAVGATMVVFPERDMAERLANILEQSSIFDYVNIGSGYGIIEIAPPNSFCGKTLRELALREKYHVQVIMIKEVVPENIIPVPNPDHVIKESDILVIMGKDEDINRIQNLN
ncbi:MAG: TrkA family potassium uptake protein [Calditrichaeota bacterium]|nr:MAG: TrkA family potassium uptake protein [Calditrichota bacterium]